MFLPLFSPDISIDILKILEQSICLWETSISSIHPVPCTIAICLLTPTSVGLKWKWSLRWVATAFATLWPFLVWILLKVPTWFLAFVDIEISVICLYMHLIPLVSWTECAYLSADWVPIIHIENQSPQSPAWANKVMDSYKMTQISSIIVKQLPTLLRHGQLNRQKISLFCARQTLSWGLVWSAVLLNHFRCPFERTCGWEPQLALRYFSRLADGLCFRTVLCKLGAKVSPDSILISSPISELLNLMQRKWQTSKIVFKVPFKLCEYNLEYASSYFRRMSRLSGTPYNICNDWLI